MVKRLEANKNLKLYDSLLLCLLPVRFLYLRLFSLIDQANKLLKQVGTTIGSTVHSAIGSTNSDNANQFGNKITTGIKEALKGWKQTKI
jgi:hypothetical protein